MSTAYASPTPRGMRNRPATNTITNSFGAVATHMLPSTLMVAREEESARIAAGLEAATVGQGHLLLVSGEPGVGKTRLAQEAVLWARKKGCIVLMGRCYEEHATSPYFPFLDVLAMAWTVAPSELHQVATQRNAATISSRRAHNCSGHAAC